MALPMEACVMMLLETGMREEVSRLCRAVRGGLAGASDAAPGRQKTDNLQPLFAQTQTASWTFPHSHFQL